MDTTALEEQLIADAQANVTGTIVNKIYIARCDLTDDKDCTIIEQTLKGKRIHSIHKIEIPFLVVTYSEGINRA